MLNEYQKLALVYLALPGAFAFILFVLYKTLLFRFVLSKALASYTVLNHYLIDNKNRAFIFTRLNLFKSKYIRANIEYSFEVNKKSYSKVVSIIVPIGHLDRLLQSSANNIEVYYLSSKPDISEIALGVSRKDKHMLLTWAFGISVGLVLIFLRWNHL